MPGAGPASAVVTLLARGTLCTTRLVARTGARQTHLPNHLRVLRDAGVVETEPCGRFTHYRLRPEIIDALAGQFTAQNPVAATAPRTWATSGGTT